MAEEKKTETADKSKAADDSGGSLGGLEVISLLTLAGSAIYFTKKKDV